MDDAHDDANEPEFDEFHRCQFQSSHARVVQLTQPVIYFPH
jgi:hypothetical protein